MISKKLNNAIAITNFPENSMFFECFERNLHFCQNKISPQCLCWGRNLRREFLDECFANSPYVSAKINTPNRNTNFSKQINEETSIQKAKNSPGHFS